MIRLLPQRQHEWRAFDAQVIHVCPVYGMLTLRVAFYCTKCFAIMELEEADYPEWHRFLDLLETGHDDHGQRASDLPR